MLCYVKAIIIDLLHITNLAVLKLRSLLARVDGEFFRMNFIGYGNGTLFLTDSDRIDTNYTQIEFDLSGSMDNSTCSNCSVLAVADECFNQTEAVNCTVNKSIFCCYNCTGMFSSLPSSDNKFLTARLK